MIPILATLLLAGCDGQNAEKANQQEYEQQQKKKEEAEKNKQAAVDAELAKLKWDVLEKPTGTLSAEKGDLAYVEYTGTTLQGKQFDTNRVPDSTPLVVRVGTGTVIPGFDKGITGMKVGERRKITMPPIIAYGEEGSPPRIGPNETLIFDIKLLDVAKAGDEAFFSNKILTPGSGDGAKNGDTVEIHYRGTLVNGKEFDNSRKPRSANEPVKPLTVTLGKGEVIKGWDVGLVGIKKGEKRVLKVGPLAGYGENAPPSIGANQILVFELECMNVKHN
jgi:FKBP-type peptidyl-prolyl cis-trans isomerase